jgi:hypothetical protein
MAPTICHWGVDTVFGVTKRKLSLVWCSPPRWSYEQTSRPYLAPNGAWFSASKLSWLQLHCICNWGLDTTRQWWEYQPVKYIAASWSMVSEVNVHVWLKIQMYFQNILGTDRWRWHRAGHVQSGIQTIWQATCVLRVASPMICVLWGSDALYGLEMWHTKCSSCPFLIIHVAVQYSVHGKSMKCCHLYCRAERF